MLSFFMEVSLPSRFFFDDKDTSFPPAFQIKADRVLVGMGFLPTHLRREICLGVGTSFSASGFIISYPLGTFLSSPARRKTINPHALEAGPYPDHRTDQTMCRREKGRMRLALIPTTSS